MWKFKRQNSEEMEREVSGLKSWFFLFWTVWFEEVNWLSCASISSSYCYCEYKDIGKNPWHEMRAQQKLLLLSVLSAYSHIQLCCIFLEQCNIFYSIVLEDYSFIAERMLCYKPPPIQWLLIDIYFSVLKSSATIMKPESRLQAGSGLHYVISVFCTACFCHAR